MTDNSSITIGRSVAVEARHVEAQQEPLDRLRSEVESLRASRQRLAVAADAERRKFERELHDGPQQHLVALAVNLQLARDLVEADPAAAKACLDEAGADVLRALAETASLAQRIYPPLLESGGLRAALRAAAESTGVKARIEVTEAAEHRPEVVGAVYFCCLEALERIGAGGQAAIEVRAGDDALVFEVVADEPEPVGSFRGLQDRVEALGGRLTIESDEGRGACLSGSIPVAR